MFKCICQLNFHDKRTQLELEIMSYRYPPIIDSAIIPPPGYNEAGSYLRHLLDKIERDLIMPIILSSTETMPFKDLLKRIVDSYNVNLSRQRERLDFSQHSTRWAYVYVFLMRHSHLVHTALVEMTKYTCNFTLWQHIRTLNVCAIGGGPGIDILGFALFLKTMNVSSDIQGTVIDRCDEWGGTWTSLNERTQDLNIKQVDFVTCDLTSSDALSKEAAARISRAHLVTLSKVISSLAAFVSNRPPPLRFPFLSAISPGTYVLYIDNATGPHTNIFRDAFCSISGFRVIADFNNDCSFPQVSGQCPNRPLVEWLSFFPAKSGMNHFIFLQRMY